MDDTLTKNEREFIRQAAAQLYRVSELKEIYEKEKFLEQLKMMLCNTPMAGGYGDMSKTLDLLI